MASRASDSARRRDGRIWDDEPWYGDTLFGRATGNLPEMESSKALAGIVKDIIQPGDRILDIGCGAGHYLKSLLSVIGVPFFYTGVDVTLQYISLARQAWAGHANVNFEVADVFSLPIDDSGYDIAFSCNVFLHLPSIKVPLQELVRVAKRQAILRTLIGERSFRIQEVYSPVTHPKSFQGRPDDDEFDENGEPKSFHFHTIYSQEYLEKLLSGMPDVKRYRIYPDRAFDPDRISAALSPDSPPDATRMVGDWQVNGYILQPWHFIEINKLSA